MPLRLDIVKKLTNRSERVKSVDLHDTNPWVLSALYSGTVMIWNYDTQSLVKSFEVTTLPVRNAKFISRKEWIVTSSDDLMIRCFNYNTMDRLALFDGHTDYIRHMEIHPTLPYLLSCADDMMIKLWNWEKNWACVQVFEGHGHYVMQVKFNPKDTNTFASAALDRTIKVWGLGSSQPHFSLEGHERGVNCIDYYPGGDKPYLVSGADDKTVKIWDYQTKAIIQTLDGHSHNLTNVVYHPRLPLIISACEDGTVRMWHSTTYRAESTLNYGMERAWSLATIKSSNKLAIGYDEGTIVLQLGHDMPVVSMDSFTGKIVWANNNDIQTTSVKGLAAELGASDGEKLIISPRDLGSCEVYPQRLQHNSNGRFIVVCGDGEYIIYTSQQLRNKSFGAGLDFAWSPLGTGDYVVRVSVSQIALFKNFKEVKIEKPRVCTAEGLFGGVAIGIKGPDCIALYDWDEFRLIRKIEVCPTSVYWSDSGELVLFVCEDCYYVLRYNRELVTESFANRSNSQDEGVEGALELVHEISEKIGTGQWIGDCFLYTTDSGRLNYYVGGEVITLSHFDQTLYMLGYLPKENRAFFMDKLRNVVSYTVSMVMLEYQTAVVRGDFDTANEILPRIPSDQIDLVARFLESQGFKEEALELSTDADQRFDLAVQLAKLDIAKQIMLEITGDPLTDQQEGTTTDAQHKWKQLGDLALNDCNFKLFQDCALRSDDFSGLLLLYSSVADATGMDKLSCLARKHGRNNVSFIALLLQGKLEECLTLLLETKRFPEAAFFARTYLPSFITHVVTLWRQDLMLVRKRAAKRLADPTEHQDLFPAQLSVGVQAEEMLRKLRANATAAAASNKEESAQNFEKASDRFDANILSNMITTGSLGFNNNITSTTSTFTNISDDEKKRQQHHLLQKAAEDERQQANEKASLMAEAAAAEAAAEAAAAQAQAQAIEQKLASEKAQETERRAQCARQEAEETARIAEAEEVQMKLEQKAAKERAIAEQKAAEEDAKAERYEAEKAQATLERVAVLERQAAATVAAAAEKAEEMLSAQVEMKEEQEDVPPAAVRQDSLDFELDNDDLDFDDDDGDWGDM